MKAYRSLLDGTRGIVSHTGDGTISTLGSDSHGFNLVNASLAWRSDGLSIAAGALLLAIGFVIFLTRRVIGPLRKQAAELRAANEVLQAEISDRSRVEAELRRSEASLALAQRMAHLGSWELSLTPEGNFLPTSLVWSAETFRIFGHEPGTTTNPWELFSQGVHRKEIEAVLTAFERSLETGEPYCIEHRIVRPDGTERIVREEAHILYAEDSGKPLQVVGTVEDITDRRRAETALREADEKYRSIFFNGMDGIFQNTPEGVFISANPALAKMLGFASPEELIRERNDLERQGYAEPAKRKEFRRLLEEKGSISNYEYEVKRKDGSIICVSESSRVVRDTAGRSLYYEGSVQDITERKRVERLLEKNEREQRELAAELRSEQARLVDAQAVAKVGSWETDLVTDRVHWSAETFRIFEVSPDHFAPTHTRFLQLVHADDRAAVDEAYRASFTGSPPAAIEHRVPMPDGRIKFVEERWHVILDEQGVAVRAVGTAQDITERKQAEEHRRAKDEAERANLAKSEFLSRMSHELRTPLNAILGFGQILEISPVIEHEKESVKHILGAGRHLLKLVDEVLDISRIESGRLELSLEPVALDQLVREALGIIRPLAEKKGIVLQPVHTTGTAGGAEIHVAADRQRLKQVFLNLLSNAVKYNAAAGTVSVDWVPAAGDERVRVRVFDSGPDIGSDVRHRLFLPFDRLGAERQLIEGTGLGLALSKRLVEAMGGSIGFAGRTRDTAATDKFFWIELPLVASPLDAAGAQGTIVGSIPLPDDTLPGSRTILYIEDNLSNLRLVERLLSPFPGVRLLTAMQGSLGLEVARRHSPDLILLDVHLPDMSGWEVLTALRDDALTRSSRVVVISADATQRQIERMTALGALAYLTKPVDVHRFLEVVAEVLK